MKKFVTSSVQVFAGCQIACCSDTGVAHGAEHVFSAASFYCIRSAMCSIHAACRWIACITRFRRCFGTAASAADVTSFYNQTFNLTSPEYVSHRIACTNLFRKRSPLHPARDDDFLLISMILKPAAEESVIRLLAQIMKNRFGSEDLNRFFVCRLLARADLGAAPLHN